MDARAQKEFQDQVRQVVGDNLKRLRKEAGLSQEELAARAGIHRTHIGFIEKGRRLPKIDTLYRVAQGLEVDPGLLLQGFPPKGRPG